ncbi:putative ribonuclease H-like domain-containing protein [Tanacetum coccineum]
MCVIRYLLKLPVLTAFNSSTNYKLAVLIFLASKPEFKGYGTKNRKKESNVVCDKKSDDSKENSNNSLVKEQVSKDTRSFVESSLNVDKKTVFPVDKKVESIKPKNHEKPVKKLVRLSANTIKGKGWPQAVNTAKPKTVKTARPNSVVVNAVRVNQANAVKASACWVWRPTKPNSTSITLKKHNYIDAQGRSKNLIEVMLHLEEEHMVVEFLATSDEINAIALELGSHDNFLETINKLVKDNLVRGLPTKHFENDQTCVACLKGKQHRASYSLGKFDGKSDEGFFVGYSLSSKAFRVYNTRTRRVEENLHIGFLENKPMIEGNGPKWLFDIDSLTQSMNYVPVAAGTIINESAGTQEELNAGTSEEISQDCIVMPIWKDASYFDSPTQDVDNGEPKSAADDQKQDGDGLDNENDAKDKSDDDSSPKEVNAAGQHVNTASPDVTTGSFKLNVVGPSVNTASSYDQDSPKDMFTIGASHTLEDTHVEFFSDEDELEVDLGNITKRSMLTPPIQRKYLPI